MVEPKRAPRYHGCQMIMYLENSCGEFDNLSRIYCYKIPISEYVFKTARTLQPDLLPVGVD